CPTLSNASWLNPWPSKRSQQIISATGEASPAAPPLTLWNRYFAIRSNLVTSCHTGSTLGCPPRGHYNTVTHFRTNTHAC
ncbi:hypothetical protein N8642_04155, partial [bacterium]|nr:hypothetical protein [bacterium]